MCKLMIDLVFAEQDSVLAENFRIFLIEATAISTKDINMISSHDIAINYSISLHKESLPILLITSGFYESPACMLALGQTVALYNTNIYPIIFPPVNYSNLVGMLTGVQVDNINDKSCLHPLWDIINKKTQCGSSRKWNEARRKMLKVLHEENLPFQEWKLIKKQYYQNPKNDLQLLISYKKMSAIFTSGQYSFLVYLNNNSNQYVVIEIILGHSYNNEPNKLLENHSKYVNNAIPRHPPLGLITIMAIKPGLPQFKIEVEKDKQLFFKFIKWWKPNSHQNFLDALDEAKNYKK